MGLPPGRSRVVGTERLEESFSLLSDWFHRDTSLYQFDSASLFTWFSVSLHL